MPQASELSKVELLSSLAAEELESLAGVIQEKRVSKGTTVIFQGDTNRSLMFIRQGKLRVTLVSEEGKEVVLAHLEEGGFFGEISLLTGEERTANVISMNECVLYVLRQPDFERHVAAHSGLALALLKALAARLGKTSERVGDLVLFDVYRRIAKMLFSMGEERTIDGIRTRIVEKRPTHKELAAMAGTSREMVTRALKELEEDGILRLEGKDKVVLYQSPA